MPTTKPHLKVSAPTINRTVLMSGADYFDVVAINPYSHHPGRIDRARATADYAAIQAALATAGVTIKSVPAPRDCQDGIFTANWGLCRGDTVVVSELPTQRQAETPYAVQALRDLGKRIVTPPFHFSGQGDALPCGNYLFAGSTYRTDRRVHDFLAHELGYEVISLQTLPERDAQGVPVVNKLTSWPDSFFYDIDLAIAIIRPDLIAWYPGAFDLHNQDKIRELPLQKIEVTDEEAANFACNLVSTGSTVVLGPNCPKLKIDLEGAGLTTIAVDVRELTKGGGFIRCTTLTLDNE